MLWKEGGLSLRRGEHFVHSPDGYWIDFVLKSGSAANQGAP